ncbi:hypothetical protein [Streptomyces sp. MMBL 11-1]|uniref:hypothetical protein n=1 Tax=Streptomyces sp. MMBL 11-1 TaxID=3026420 RepID=UPI00236189C4|nr:hypothetical protein [Streptomyces sp. MMBL 11-1]
MTEGESPALTPTARAHLKGASCHPHGHLSGSVSKRLLRAMFDAGYIYREDLDGFRLEGEAALTYDKLTPWRITVSGRRAVLTPSQVNALVDRVGLEGRFAAQVTWSTTRSLAELRLAEYRDADRVVQPNDGDDGVRGPRNSAYRTSLGDAVAELAASREGRA